MTEIETESDNFSAHRHNDGERHLQIFYWLFFVLSICVIMSSVVISVKYKAYKNLSTLTLIGLVILMWSWTCVIWSFFVWEPPFFYNNLLTMMDLTNFMSYYFSGLMSTVLFLQWAQLYKILANR